jgi:hypothetical protein
MQIRSPRGRSIINRLTLRFKLVITDVGVVTVAVTVVVISACKNAGTLLCFLDILGLTCV